MTKPNYEDMATRAALVRASMIERACRECELAGLDPSIPGIHLHNAWVSFRSGKPWRGVNYTHVRRARWIMDRSFEPERIVDRWWRRTHGLCCNR